MPSDTIVPNQPNTAPITILIAEDLELVRFGIRFALEKEPRIKVLGEAENGEQALELVAEHHPQVILMDVGMPIMDGLEATRLIKQRFPDIRIVMLTSRDQSATVYESLGAGADAYCLKGVTVEQLLPALETVLAGHSWLDAQIASLILEDLASDSTTAERIGRENMAMLSRIRDGEEYPTIAQNASWTMDELNQRLNDTLRLLAQTKQPSTIQRRF
jgi:DNA-binding NarL/FixJ family response regulator